MSRSKNLTRQRLLSGLLLVVCATPAFAWMNKQERAEVDAIVSQLQALSARQERTERLIENADFQKLFIRIQQTEEDNRQLRGYIEELEYALEQQQQREKQLNLDLDQRMQALESRTSAFESSSYSGPVGDSTVADYQDPNAMNSSYSGGSSESSAIAALDEQGQYAQAFDYLKSGLYQPSIEGFQQFLQLYPASSLAANAQYWLGEANYGAGEYEQAVADFKNVILMYSGSSKESDASLKLGYSHYALKQWDSARAILQEVVNKFAGTSAAQLATERLKRMKQEGR